MQTATSETESKSRDLSICVHHYTLRAPCPKGQGNALRVRRRPVVVWTEAWCPRSVSVGLGSLCVLRVGQGSSRPLREGSSAVLPTCLFRYFSVFREPHRMVLPGNVRFQAGDGLLTDWCSPDFDCIDHSVANSKGKRCVRPCPSGVGYLARNSG